VAALRARLAANAQNEKNLMPVIIDSVENDVTLGEMCDTLRQVWGEYQPGAII
jgi:methylmalonyl-CoA mutase N-terminal domain/subunit